MEAPIRGEGPHSLICYSAEKAATVSLPQDPRYMSPNPPPSPQRIGKYEIEQFLGGGMSAVYRARDTLINRKVALKVLKEAYRPEDPTAQRFVLEAQIAGNLNHENVIRTYDFGFDPDGRPYMVLEYLEGEDLAQIIKSGLGGDLANRARIAWELAGALEYIHPRNVIHRDLKPANIFLSGGPLGTVKLMDFGISRTEAVSITQAGTTMGTPGYMSPEQIHGEPVTKAVDIYAYGVVLWELFTSRRAFAGDTLDRVFYMVLNEPLDIDKLRAAGVPAELALQIGKCAAKEAWKRPHNLQAIRTELQRLISGAQGAALSDDLGPTMEMPALAKTVVSTPAQAAPPAPAPAGKLAQPPAPAPPPPAPASRPQPEAGRKLVLGAAGAGAALVAVLALWFFFAGEGKDSRSGGDSSSGAATTAKLAEEIATTTGLMLLVPEVAFQFGRDKQPVKEPAFYIDKTEVTNGAFAAYARATNAALPPGFAADKPELPVVNLTFDQALAFAQWAGKRLPTTRQWEKAARGLDGRAYPWGDLAEPHRANVGAGRDKGSLVAVTLYPDGASPFHALQMVGNAWEWVDETAAPSAEMIARFASQLQPPPTAAERWVEIRGGSYAEPLDPKVLWDKVAMPARYRSPIIGFRCVKPALE